MHTHGPKRLKNKSCKGLNEIGPSVQMPIHATSPDFSELAQQRVAVATVLVIGLAGHLTEEAQRCLTKKLTSWFAKNIDLSKQSLVKVCTCTTE